MKQEIEKNINTSQKKRLDGIVVSNKMKDTIVVKVDRYIKHPKYGKYYTKSEKFKAHNPGNTKNIGETVIIEECRPIS
mgnify:CR=1 FL=1